MDRILDLLVLSSATGGLFSYARNADCELPFKRPSREHIKNELQMLLDWRAQEIGELSDEIETQISNGMATRLSGGAFEKYAHVI